MMKKNIKIYDEKEKVEVDNVKTDSQEIPFVSIIVPVYNGERYIGDSLKSLEMLDYPKDNFELIIVDNGSKDRTIEIIDNFQKLNGKMDIKLFVEHKKGAYSARNLGVKNAKGEILAFTDADCIVDKHWLNNIVQYFSDTSVGGVAGEILPQKGNSLVERYAAFVGMWSQKVLFESRRMPYAQAGNAAYRKDLFSRIGYFDETYSGGDADFSLRMQFETNYKMLYGGNAVVVHNHKENLKGLFKQNFRYGCAYIYLQEKYGERFKNPFNTKSSANKDAANYIIKIVNYMINSRNDLLLIFPAFVHICGYRSGKIYAKFLKNHSK